MSEEPAPYNRTFSDGPWSVRWSAYPEEPNPIMLCLEHPDGPDDWDCITVSLSVERAMLLRLAIDRALGR